MSTRGAVMRWVLPAFVLVAIPAASLPGSPRSGGDDPDRPPLGYSAAAWDREERLEEEYAALLLPDRISHTHEALTRDPHSTGSEGGRRVVQYLRAEIEKTGLHAEIASYLFYNPHRGAQSIEMTAPVRAPLSLVEDRIPGDPFTDRAASEPAYCAYSGTGDAEGEVVYLGQGTAREFEAVEKQGISLRGRIALMRYFGEAEGRKVVRAQQRGAVGAILFSDPQDDGFVQGPVYPSGPWRPPGSIMRRTLADTPFEGDPLSPGWASVPGARRLDPQQVEGLPAIPVLPISYRDAGLLLSHLEGPPAPAEMQGGLRKRNATGGVAGGEGAPPAVPEGVTLVDVYRLGPGPARVRMSVRTDRRSDTIQNVLVRIPGREEPNTWIILGNHHDAWIYGAGDPSSGTAALLETVRGLGKLQASGWRPRRTMVIAFWDAEELNLGGSTEWMEDHAEDLRRKAAAVINMDSAVFNGGRPLYAGASPCLHRLFLEVAAAVPSPDGAATLQETWLRSQNASRDLPSADGFAIGGRSAKPLLEPQIDEVPLGDDQTPFVEHLGLPGSDMYYGADYGMYHSLYENRHWMTTIVDPQFRLHRTMAEFQGRLGLRLAMAPILPLEPSSTASAWNRAFVDLSSRAGERGASRLLRPVARALRRYRDAADDLGRLRDEYLERADTGTAPGPDIEPAVSREISEAEKALYSETGLPGFPWYRGLWVAPPRPVPGLTDVRLPGLRWPLERGDEGMLIAQVTAYGQALDEATSHLHRAAALLRPADRERPR